MLLHNDKPFYLIIFYYVLDNHQIKRINFQSSGTITILCDSDYVPPSSNICQIAVIALIKGQFEFPKGAKLASAVYNISFSQPLAKPLKLIIQHCVNLKTQAQANCLRFVIALSSTSILPNQFTLVKGGQFHPGSRYGVIDMTGESSCLVAIVADQEQQSQETNKESSLDTIPTHGKNFRNNLSIN